MKKPYWFIPLLASLIARGRQNRRTGFDSQRIERIWIHKPDHLGDAILARSALCTIRNAWPNAKIFVACGPETVPLLPLENPSFKLEPFDNPFLGGCDSWLAYRRRVRRVKPDLLINLRHDLRDILLCWSIRAPYLATFDHRGLAVLATHPGPAPAEDRAEADNNLELLREALGLKPCPASPMTLPPGVLNTARALWDATPGSGPKILIHGAARTPAKLWPVAQWRSLLKMLRENWDARTAVIGQTCDAGFNREMVRQIQGIQDWTGRLDLIGAAAAIAAADLLVGIDSGPGHLAAAVGTPVVSIMSGTNSTRRWSPDYQRALVHSVPCAPCRLTQCSVSGHPCLREIAPEAVFKMTTQVRRR